MRDEINAMPPRLAPGGAHRGRLRAMAGRHPPAPRHLPAVNIGIRGHVDVVMPSHDATSAVDVTSLVAGPVPNEVEGPVPSAVEGA